VTYPAVAAAVNPTAVIAQALAASSAVADALAAVALTPSDSSTVGKVLGEARAPYPMLQVLDGAGGDLGRVVWGLSGEVQINAWGTEERRVGPDALRRLLGTALDVVARLPDLEAVPGEPVVTDVTVSAPQRLDEPDGQIRYFSLVTISLHPPLPS